jgi:hypothetical protein
VCDAPKIEERDDETAILCPSGDTTEVQSMHPATSSIAQGTDIQLAENTKKVVRALKTDETDDTVETPFPSGVTGGVQSSAQSASFTLRDAERELRVLYRALSDAERQEWTERANMQADSIHDNGVINGQAKKEQACVPAPNHVVRCMDASESLATGCVSPSCSESGAEHAVVSGSTSGEIDAPSKFETKHAAEKMEPVSSSIVAPSPPPNVNLEQMKAGIPGNSLEVVTGEMIAPYGEKCDPSVAIIASKRARDSKPLFPTSTHWRLDQEQVRLCYNAGTDHFNSVMVTVKARDLERELQDGFDLLRERGRGRYDMELPALDTPAFRFLTVGKAPWMPVVREILGKDVALIHKGMFLSLPGAEPQEYHQDGPHLNTQYQKPCHAVNVFVPLVDLSMRSGPTEFCLGSHILGQEEYDKEFLETPLVPAGTPIIFDYRLGHLGLGNSSDACRPILYCTYAAAADGKEFRDSVNFSRKRYHRIGDLVSKTPSREERKRKRELAAEEQQVELEEQQVELEEQKVELAMAES